MGNCLATVEKGPGRNQAAMSDTKRRSDTLVKYNIKMRKVVQSEAPEKVDEALYM